MKKSIKKFRLNFVISYEPCSIPEDYREPIHAIFKNLAWLYRLDYSISSEHPFVQELDSTDPDSAAFLSEGFLADLLYFRSTDLTRIDAKSFRKIIVEIFSYDKAAVMGGVFVFVQIQKYLSKYPFPKDYCHPLDYPYIELHEEDHISVCIPSGDLSKC